MARLLSHRYRVEGTLVVTSAIHVGMGASDHDSDLALARDGRGRLFIPGTSLAGALQHWCALAYDPQDGGFRALWGQASGPEHQDNNASLLIVDDAILDPTSSPTSDDALKIEDRIEIRDGVRIDRCHGHAADEGKFDRAVLPQGTHIPLNLTLEIPNKTEANQKAVAMLGHMLDALKRGDIALGAARSRGLGHVTLHDQTIIIRQDFADAQGILQALAGGGIKQTPTDLAALSPRTPQHPPTLTFEITWKPKLPTLVKAGYAGIGVDTIPLVTAQDDGEVVPLIPGSSLKGILRSQAERILRTLNPRTADGDDDCVNDWDADTKGTASDPLIAALFGVAPKPLSKKSSQFTDGQSTNGPSPGLAALWVGDCRSRNKIPAQCWKELTETSTDLTPDNLFTPVAHVAIDRWLGGAADGLLFSTLEPKPDAADWDPITLTLHMQRISEQDRDAAVILVLLLIRDMAQGFIPIGFGTERGLGAICVETVRIAGRGLKDLGPLSQFQSCPLWKIGCPATSPLAIPGLQQAWDQYLGREKQ